MSCYFTVSSGSDRVKRGDESKLQRYRVADRESEAFGLGPEYIERSAISTYISEQQGARFFGGSGSAGLVSARLLVALRQDRDISDTF